MNIIPGEPVPPGFEDEVNRVAEIQQAIDQYKGNALIGLEYTLELHSDEDRRNPNYLCVLCDKRGDPRNIMQHWTSFNHRLKYLEKHYASAVREFKPVTYKPNSHALMVSIVQSIAEAIEDHHGRLALSVCSAEDFRRMKGKITAEINAKYHYDERNGPSFINVIDRTLWENNPVPAAPTVNAKKMDQTLQITIKAPKRLCETDPNEPTANRDLDEISSDSDGGGGGEDGPKRAKKHEQVPAYRVLPRVRRSPPFEEERKSGEKENNNAAASVDPKKLPTPKELSLQASHIAQERYKWEKYRCMLEIQLKQMEKLQQDYEKNPEKHPLYPEEWKKFWNRRYKELQAEKKIDPNKHDYKPEWIVYWTMRMKELFNAEVDKKKKEIKVKLGLPEDAEEKVDQLKEKYKVQVQRNTNTSSSKAPVDRGRDKDAPPARSSRSGGREKASSTAVIDISDDEEIGGGDRGDGGERSPRNYARRRHSRSISPARNTRRGGGRSGSPDYKRSRPRNLSRSPARSRSPMREEYDRRRGDDRYERERHRGSHALPSSSRGGYPVAPEMDFYSSTFSRSRYPAAPPPPSHYDTPPLRYRVMDPHAYPKYERSPTPNSKSAKEVEHEPEEDIGPLTVVAVLRLLTALEDHLGSLGPKVVDLLGKALALEKFKANSADDMLMNDDHCVFFETIKEKLKGLLIADVLDDQQKVRAVKKAVKNIAAIVHQVSMKGKKTNENDDDDMHSSHSDFLRNSLKKSGSQRPSVKDLPFDRQVVSTKLAAALVMQGREDVSTDDMDKLIYMFLLMVKLSKAKYEAEEKVLYTKDILPELGLPVPLSPAQKFASLPAIVGEILENDASTLQELEDEISNDAAHVVEPKNNDTAASSMLESLTDSDLQTLLQNFKHLSTEEQHHLIAHLKKLETADAARVEKLRKFVNLTDLAEIATPSTATGAATSSMSSSSKTTKQKPESSTSASNARNRRYDDSPPPGSNSRGYSHYSEDDVDNDVNDNVGDNSGDRRRGVGGGGGGGGGSSSNSHLNVNPNKFSLDDEGDEDDYNFDEIFKAASSNVNRLNDENSRHSSSKYDEPSSSLSASRNQTQSAKPIEPIVPVSSSPSALTFNPAGLSISLSETQNLIANLMGSLQQSNASQNSGSSKAAAAAANNQPKQQPTQQAPQPVPPIRAHHQQQQQQAAQSNMPYYQQGQQQQQSQQQQQQQQAAAFGGYNQMGAMGNQQAQAYYNAMGSTGHGYNQTAANGYAGYQQQPWANGQQMQSNMQQFGMQGMQYGMTPQQQQQHQQQQQQQMGGYNMYGRGGN